MMKDEELIEMLKKAFSKNIEENKRYLMFQLGALNIDRVADGTDVYT